MCQCPLGLIPHFYLYYLSDSSSNSPLCVNALSGLYLISTKSRNSTRLCRLSCVNALSGLYLISTRKERLWNSLQRRLCQCPLGLIPHFYWNRSIPVPQVKWRVSMPSRAYTSFLPVMYYNGYMTPDGCQCPLGLIPHFYAFKTHNLERFCKNVSMPSRAYTSFLRYPFKNLGFMRFPEPVFAGIYQNILTAAVFRAC